MAPEGRFVATVLGERVPTLSGSLKRLALFCDEIKFLLPSFAVIKPEVMDDPARVTIRDDEKNDRNP